MIFWKTIIFSHTVIWVRCARMVFDETNHDKWERLQVECYITKLLIPGSTRRWWWLYDYGALVESYWKKTTEVLGDKNLSQWHFFDYTLHTYQPGKKNRESAASWRWLTVWDLVIRIRIDETYRLRCTAGLFLQKYNMPWCHGAYTELKRHCYINLHL